MFASPIISVIYQHGRFNARNDARDCRRAGVLRSRSRFLCSVEGANPCVLRDRQTQHANDHQFLCDWRESFSELAFTFRLGWGHRGLAFSTSLVATINFLLLYALMRRHVRRLETRQLLIGLGKCVLPAQCWRLVCWAANYRWLGAWSRAALFPKTMRAAHCNRVWRCGVLWLRLLTARERGAGHR